jgi:opacity protein-like surface antigen
MGRHVRAAVVVGCLIPLPAAAQTVVITITTASADVHKSPTVASPVIGQAARGRVLEVTRDVRVHSESLSTGAGSAPNRAAGITSVPPTTESVPSSASDVRADIATVAQSSLANERNSSAYVTPPTHTIGIGGLMNGSTIGFGATGRMWPHRRFGAQIELSRYTQTTAITGSRVNSLLFAPSLVYSVMNRVTDSFWFRPYLGTGAKVSRATSTIGTTAMSVSENRTSWQVFGGSELTLPSASRFALSADLRYDSSRAPFAGFDIGGLGFTVAGHWYVK